MIEHDLIEQVGGIELARGIVEGAPDNTALHYSNEDGDLVYFRDGDYYDNDYGDWFEIYFMMPDLISLYTLRTAIAEHDNTQLCIECGSPDLHKGGEIKEPKMCFKCYAAMTGFTLIGDQLLEDDELAEIKAGHRIDKQLESDDCTDIRNHVSPSTKVVDL